MPDALAPAAEALVALSAALATRDEVRVSAALRAAAEVAVPGEVDEAILQAHLFVGFPTALRAMSLWRAMGAAPPATVEPAGEAVWEERGARACETVYGSAYARLRERVVSLHPDLDRWMVVGGYGRVLGRPGLALPTRELCIVALLLVWNAPEQLHSHLRGALHAGASQAELDRAVEIASGYASPAAVDAGRELLERVRARHTATRNRDHDGRPTSDD